MKTEIEKGKLYISKVEPNIIIKALGRTSQNWFSGIVSGNQTKDYPLNFISDEWIIKNFEEASYEDLIDKILPNPELGMIKKNRIIEAWKKVVPHYTPSLDVLLYHGWRKNDEVKYDYRSEPFEVSGFYHRPLDLIDLKDTYNDSKDQAVLIEKDKNYQSLSNPGLIVKALEVRFIEHDHFHGEVIESNTIAYSVGKTYHGFKIENFEEYEEADIKKSDLDDLLLGGYFNIKNNERVSITTKYGLTIYLEKKQMIVWNKIEKNQKERTVIGEFQGKFISVAEKGRLRWIEWENAKPIPDKPQMTIEQIKEKLGFDFDLVKE